MPESEQPSGIIATLIKRMNPTLKQEEFPPNLEVTWEKQVDKLLLYGFDIELRMTREEYRESIPKFLPQPTKYNGIFNVPLIVETRIPLGKMHELLGIPQRSVDETNEIINLTPVPETPYTVWTHDGRRHQGRPIIMIERNFREDEVKSPQIEVTNLFLQYPNFFPNFFKYLPWFWIAAAGSRYKGKEGFAPCIEKSLGQLRFDECWIGDSSRFCCPLSRGKEINTAISLHT